MFVEPAWKAYDIRDQGVKPTKLMVFNGAVKAVDINYTPSQVREKDPDSSATNDSGTATAQNSLEGEKRCDVDHLKEGFEGVVVYCWKGVFKGKLGRVGRLSGTLARVHTESGKVLDIPVDRLVA